MRTISSFTVDHDRLERGVYVSRIDGDVVTYDIRMKKPNAGDYLSPHTAHTMEHILATFIRNSEYTGRVVYVGPMGCLTGFYLLLRDSVSREQVLGMLRDAFQFLADYEGELPGGTRKECGNYRLHDLEGAKREAAGMLEVLSGWNADKMDYIQ